MNLDDLTLGQLKQLQGLCGSDTPHPYRIGQNYLIRTVTHYWVGHLKEVYKQEVVLSDASWIADTGRFAKSLKEGFEGQSNTEIEPVYKGDVILGRGSFIDVCEWNHDLPEKTK